MATFLQKPSKTNNAIDATWVLIKALSLQHKITRSSLSELLLAHPEYPSLQSISDVLTRFKVENASFKLTLAQLQELPAPLLVHLRTQGGTFVIITQQQQDAITYSDGISHTTESLTDFTQKWTGVTLIAEPTQAAGEPNYPEKRKQERWQQLRSPALLAIAAILLVSVAGLNALAFTWLTTTALTFKLIGLVASGLLLAVHIEGKQSFASSLCQLNDKTDCNAILTSPAAMLWGWVSWAELGFLYYAGGAACLCLGMLTNQLPATLTLLAGLSFLALPYTVFSVYYQWQVAKQWCTLCLAVQVLLVAEAFLYGFSISFTSPSMALFALALIGFGLPVGGWLLLKPLWKDSLQLRKTKRELSKLKNNPELFGQLLRQQPAMPALTPLVQAIRLGTPDAAHTLVVVTNPYCGPCAKAHEVLDNLLKYVDVQIKVIIYAQNDERDTSALISKHLLAIAEMNDAKKTENAFNEWYKTKRDYNRFSAIYPANGAIDKQGVKLEAMANWCLSASITHTPTVFINGFKLPQNYTIDDLKYILEDNKVLV